jgi:hypothetical protein
MSIPAFTLNNGADIPPPEQIIDAVLATPDAGYRQSEES